MYVGQTDRTLPQTGNLNFESTKFDPSGCMMIIDWGYPTLEYDINTSRSSFAGCFLILQHGSYRPRFESHSKNILFFLTNDCGPCI